MEVAEILEGIFNVSFENQYNLCSTFLRFAEYYESPEFRGKIFTFSEFEKWYIANSPKGKESGKFTYYEDWAGFNFPSQILGPFFEGRFNPLSYKEERLLGEFEDLRNNGDFYIIGTCDGLKEKTLEHEIAHGLFYTQREYRDRVIGVIDGIPRSVRVEINEILRVGGYHPAVFDDETHSYILTDLKYLEKRNFDVDKVTSFVPALKEIFDEYVDRLRLN